MGKKYGNYHLQYLFDDLHAIYMFFTYYVNFQLFQCITIKDGRFLTQTIKVKSENNLILKERPFTYTRRGLSVLPAANFQSLQIRQIRFLAKINRIAVLVVFVILSGRCTSFLHLSIRESNPPFTFQLQRDYLLQFNKISLNSVFCSIKLAQMAPRSEGIFNTKPLILTSTTALERLPTFIRFRQC